MKFSPIVLFMGFPLPLSSTKRVGTQTLASLHGRSESERVSDRLRARKARRASVAKIVGGSPANPGDYPWFVDWGGCGGSLVHPDIVLSAAHCAGDNDVVNIGAYKSNKSPDYEAELMTVERAVIHPDYNSDTDENDIMVLKLESASTKPTLSLASVNPPVGTPLIAIGHGTTSPDGGLESSTLLQVTLPYISDSICSISYGNLFYPDVMLCAGYWSGGFDTCRGDSGGPLFYDVDGTGNFAQVGVTSWGYGCGKKNFYGVYTRVAAFKSWIDDQICLISDFRPPSCPPITPPPTTPPTPAPTIPPGSTPVQVDVFSDNWPHDLSWSITQNNIVVAARSQGAYFLPDVLVSESIHLLPGEYIFTITDSFGDGLCCAWGEGYVNIYAKLPNGELLLAAIDGDFGSDASATLDVPEPDTYVSSLVGPNPSTIITEGGF